MHYRLIVSLLTMLAVLTMLAMITGCADSGKQMSDIEVSPQPVSDIERGRYVVELMGCNDCHTPGYMVTRSNVPEEEWLIGSTLGFLSPMGTTYPTNLRLLLNNMSEEE